MTCVMEIPNYSYFPLPTSLPSLLNGNEQKTDSQLSIMNENYSVVEFSNKYFYNKFETEINKTTTEENTKKVEAETENKENSQNQCPKLNVVENYNPTTFSNQNYINCVSNFEGNEKTQVAPNTLPLFSYYQFPNINVPLSNYSFTVPYPHKNQKLEEGLSKNILTNQQKLMNEVGILATTTNNSCCNDLNKSSSRKRKTADNNNKDLSKFYGIPKAKYSSQMSLFHHQCPYHVPLPGWDDKIIQRIESFRCSKQIQNRIAQFRKQFKKGFKYRSKQRVPLRVQLLKYKCMNTIYSDLESIMEMKKFYDKIGA